MDFRFYFENQLKMHPSMQYQDVVKLCYQSAFGAEHILSDAERAKAYLCAEFESVLITDEPLFEQISPEIVRVNLGAWKREGRELDPLFEAFKKSVFINENSIEIFLLYLDTAKKTMVALLPNFNEEQWFDFLEEYKANGIKPIHHSNAYRENEKPSYRIVKITELEKIL